ncbi:MAG: serine/threonine-protein kinase [Pseudomonadota bacterium]
MSTGPLASGARFGRYKILHCIAVGGMGELYLAERQGLAGFTKQLVVKRIRPALAHDPEFVDMFLNEGRIAALINHPNVVHIYELGEVDGVYFLAMEYVPGKNLTTILKKLGGPLELPHAIHIVLQVCEGLAFAHEAKDNSGRSLELVHRDVSPPNVIVGYYGSVKLTDFGIAKVVRTKQTATGVLKGKFAYLSPEQARGKGVDRRSDIYSLGLLLFETTVGVRAIPEGDEAEVLYWSANARVRSASEILPDYPSELEGIFKKATAISPEDRYQRVEHLREDLLAFQIENDMVMDPIRLSNMMEGLFPEEVLSEAKFGPRALDETWSSNGKDMSTAGLDETPEGDLVKLPRSRSALTLVAEEPGTPSVLAPPREGAATIESSPTAETLSDSTDFGEAETQRLHKDGTEAHTENLNDAFERVDTEAFIETQSIDEGDEETVSETGFDLLEEKATNVPSSRKGLPWIAGFAVIGAFAVTVAAYFLFSKGASNEENLVSAIDARRFGKLQIEDAEVQSQDAKPTSDIGASSEVLVMATDSRTLDKQVSRSLDQRIVRRRAKIQTRAKMGKGKLIVKVRPWAYVVIDGVRIGTTPMDPVELPEGTYTVKLTNDSVLEPYVTKVTIRPGQITTLLHRF